MRTHERIIIGHHLILYGCEKVFLYSPADVRRTIAYIDAHPAKERWWRSAGTSSSRTTIGRSTIGASSVPLGADASGGGGGVAGGEGFHDGFFDVINGLLAGLGGFGAVAGVFVLEAGAAFVALGAFAGGSDLAADEVAGHEAVVDAEGAGEHDELADDAAAGEAVEDGGGAADGPERTFGFAGGIAALELVVVPDTLDDESWS